MNMRKIYRKIAKEHNVSVAEVKREMEAAVAQAWTNSNKTAVTLQRRKRFLLMGPFQKLRL